MMKNYPTGKELKSLRETLCKEPAGMAALLARTSEAYASLEKEGIRSTFDKKVTKECLELSLREHAYSPLQKEAIQAFISKLG